MIKPFFYDLTTCRGPVFLPLFSFLEHVRREYRVYSVQTGTQTVSLCVCVMAMAMLMFTLGLRISQPQAED